MHSYYSRIFVISVKLFICIEKQQLTKLYSSQLFLEGVLISGVSAFQYLLPKVPSDITFISLG